MDLADASAAAVRFTDKTNAADLSNGVFTILITLVLPDLKIHCPFTNFIKNWQTVTQQRKH